MKNEGKNEQGHIVLKILCLKLIVRNKGIYVCVCVCVCVIVYSDMVKDQANLSLKSMYACI